MKKNQREPSSRERLRKLSVVIPARNEQDCIASTVEHLHLELRLNGIDHEIIVVDDGSTDNTWRVLGTTSTRVPTLRPIRNTGPNRKSFPFLRDGPFCLFTDELDPTQAVIYDRDWFLDTIRSCGLSIQQTIYPPMPGHQWNVLLTRRTANAVEEFPLGVLGAEWLCGTTKKPMAKGGYLENGVVKCRDLSRKIQ